MQKECKPWHGRAPFLQILQLASRCFAPELQKLATWWRGVASNTKISKTSGVPRCSVVSVRFHWKRNPFRGQNTVQVRQDAADKVPCLDVPRLCSGKSRLQWPRPKPQLQAQRHQFHLLLPLSLPQVSQHPQLTPTNPTTCEHPRHLVTINLERSGH